MTEETSLPADAPAPRLCHLIKWPDFEGYGFNLHAEKSKSGQFVGKVDDESPAQGAGLREGDRIIEVNGVNIANENHRQVVERIKANPRETKLLVIEEPGDQWYKDRGLVIRGSQANVVFHATPEKKPCIKVEADSDSTAAETQSRDKGESPITGSSEAPTDCVNGESESAVSSPCLATELKSGMDSTAKNDEQENRQESKSVTRESEASVEPDITGKSITEEAVVVVANSSNNSVPQTPLQATEVIVVMSSEPEVTDQTQEKGDEAARADSNGVTADSNNETDVVVSASHALPDATTASQQKDSDQINNNNNITSEVEKIKSPSRDVADSVTVQVKANGVNGHVTTSMESSSGSPAVPASPTSLKSNSSGSTSGHALSSLGSGGEGNLEMSLNMSVSQMRQMLAQKKKVDPKKVAMDLKQKYEIISSM